MNSWTLFEEFVKFERKHLENSWEYVLKKVIFWKQRMHRRTISDFDLKFRKLEKLQIKLPLEILAFKLLSNLKLRKQERMLVLGGVNFAYKQKMYKQTKHSLI